MSAGAVKSRALRGWVMTASISVVTCTEKQRNALLNCRTIKRLDSHLEAPLVMHHLRLVTDSNEGHWLDAVTLIKE